MLGNLISLSVSAMPEHQKITITEGYKIIGNVHKEINDTETDDPVLKSLHTCLYGHGDTIGINTCISVAYEHYDKILNDVYQEALKENDDETKSALRSSQRKWLAFRDSERTAQQNYCKTNGGTVMGIVIGYQNLSAIRERITELMFYLGADSG